VVRLVAFLRAINVGGHNVKMEHLRSLISGYGLCGWFATASRPG